MNRHAEIFFAFLDKLHEADLRYVIIRGFYNFPERPDTDVDIVLEDQNLDNLIKIASDCLTIRKEAPYENNGFAEYCDMLYQPLFTPPPNDPSLPNAAFRLDCYNCFAFSSPYGGFKNKFTIPLSASTRIFDQRILVGKPGYYIPCPEDEITLLICRNVLDFQGNWKKKHIDRIKALTPSIRFDILELSISTIFPYAKQITEAVKNDQFQSIKNILKL